MYERVGRNNRVAVVARGRTAKLASVLAWILVSTTVLAGGQPALPGGAKVHVAGIRIVAEPYNDEQELRAFNMFPGTTLALQVEHPGGGLIAFDEHDSKLERLEDDKGTNLLVEREFSVSGFSMWPQFSKDGRAALIEASGGGVPARGTKEVRAGGVLIFKRAKTHAKAKCEKIVLKKDTQFEAGPYRFTVESVDTPDWGDAAMQIKLRTKQDTDALKAVTFVDPSGKEIEADESSRGSYGFSGDMTYDRSFNLSRRADTVTIEIEYWKDMETVRVPFDIKIAAGM